MYYNKKERRRALSRFIAFMFLAVVALSPAVAGADVVSVAYASNANNLSSGTVSIDRLPVGTGATNVAAGNDGRFNSLPYGQPASDAGGANRVLVWVE